MKQDNENSNAGIKDQLAAIKWVKSNIEAFGGDPNQITLFGHSAGAISVGILVLSPESRTLFKRAIIQSGVPHPFLRPDSPEVADRKSLQLAKFVKCSQEADTSISPESMECLRNLDAVEILKYAKNEKSIR